MAEKQLLLSFFADEEAADAAAGALKESGVASGDAIGLLVLDDAGNLKTDKVGARSWVAGAGVGACLVLLGPVGLGAGAIAAGALHHKGLRLDDDDKARIAADLGEGKAAVGVLLTAEAIPEVQTKLIELGGATSAHDVVDEDAVQAAAAEHPA